MRAAGNEQVRLLGTIGETTFWSDGPQQFKSSEYMSSCSNDVMLELKLLEHRANYGAQNNGNDMWDQVIATMKKVWHKAVEND